MATSNRTDSAIEIQLTQNQVTVIDDIDADLGAYKWYALRYSKGNTTPRFNAIRGQWVDGKRITHYLHRIILERVLGRSLTQKELVDHIDGDALNNRRSNLRLANASQNQANRGPQANNACGYKGVYWNKREQKWKASIKVQGKDKHLGYFSSAEAAHAAYVEAAKHYFGEFSRGSW